MAKIKLSQAEVDAFNSTPNLNPTTGIARGVGDLGVNLLKGTLLGGKMLSDAVTANNPVSNVIQSGIEGLDSLRSQGAKDQDIINSARRANAEQKGGWSEVGAELKNFSQSPLDTIALGAGTIVPALVAQKLGGSAATKSAISTGVGTAMGAGVIKGEVYDAVKKAHIDAGKTEQEADALATEAQSYTGKNADQIALGAGLGALAGGTGVESIAARLGAKEIGQEAGQFIAKDLLKKTLSDAGKEAIPEAIQGGQERVATNVAQARDGFDVDTWQGVAGNATLEGLAASPLGGGLGAAEYVINSRKQLATTLAQTGSGSLTDAALTSVLGGASDQVLSLPAPTSENYDLVVFHDGSTMARAEAEKRFTAKELAELQKPTITVDSQGRASTDKSVLDDFRTTLGVNNSFDSRFNEGVSNANRNNDASTTMATNTSESTGDNAQGSVADLPIQPNGTGMGDATATPPSSIGTDVATGTATTGDDAVEDRPFASATDDLLGRLLKLTDDTTVKGRIATEMTLRGIEVPKDNKEVTNKEVTTGGAITGGAELKPKGGEVNAPVNVENTPELTENEPEGQRQIAHIGSKGANEVISLKPNGDKFNVMYNGYELVDYEGDPVTVKKTATLDEIKAAVKASGQLNGRIITYNKDYQPSVDNVDAGDTTEISVDETPKDVQVVDFASAKARAKMLGQEFESLWSEVQDLSRKGVATTGDLNKITDVFSSENNQTKMLWEMNKIVKEIKSRVKGSAANDVVQETVQTDKPSSIDELKQLRQELSDKIQAQGIVTNARDEERLKQVNDAISEAENKVQPKPVNLVSESQFANNKVFTADKVEAARARIKSKLGNINSGIDPELLIDGMTIAGAYIESGVRKFSDYSKAMISDFGDSIKPYLLSFYEASRAYPDIDKDGMTSAEDAKKEYEALLTPEVKETIKEVIGNGNIKADKKPAKRNGESTLTQDWGVKPIDGWTDNKSGTGRNERENGITNGVKDQFLAETKKYLTQVSGLLADAGFEPYKLKNGKDDKAVTVNESGVATSGYVTLSMRDGDVGVYLNIGASSISFMSGGHPQNVAVMGRAFNNADKNRWGGGQNNWLPTDLNATALAEKMIALANQVKAKQNTTDAQNYVKNTNDLNQFKDMAIGERRTGNDGAVYERTNEGYEQVLPPLNPYLTKDKENAGTNQAEPVPDGNTQNNILTEQSRSGDSKPMDARVGGTSETTNADRNVSSGVSETSGNGTQSVSGSSESEPSSRPRETSNARNQSSTPNDGITDFEITDDVKLGEGGLTKKYRDNVEAIKIIKTLEAENRIATPEERKQLARYVGFGALKGVFDRENKQWSKKYQELKELLTEDEYKAARASVLNAHFTAKSIVDSMYDAVSRLGFNGGRVLEPSLGSGNFFGLMPASIRNKSQLNGVELDVITSRLAKYLYPNANIATATGFEEYQAPSGYFDLVIGNPPFGSEKIFDTEKSPYSGFSIHNYFLAKGIDKLRDGGVMAVVVSHNFMDVNNSPAREWIAKRANLIAAVRLPDTAFQENAGTEVVTDILFFQKTATPEDNPLWLESKELELENPKTGDKSKHFVNQYFIGNPRNVLGKESAAGTMYKGDSYTVESTGDVAQQLKAFVNSLPQNLYIEPAQRVEVLDNVDNTIPDGVKVGTYFRDESGAIRQRLTDVMNKKRSMVWEAPNNGALNRMIAMMTLRDTLRNQMRLERDYQSSETQIDTNRKSLNRQYDDFLKKYGYLNSMTNRRLFMDDTESALLQALELDYDQGVSKAKALTTGLDEKPASAQKADIFRQRVLFPPSDAINVNNAKDALLSSLNVKGFVDVDYMADVYKKPVSEIISELGDVVYNDPQKGYVTADEYLSGDVKTKLAEAISVAKTNTEFNRNVTALEKVIPKDKLPSEIYASVGANWIPRKVYSEFASEITGIPANKVEFTYISATAVWLNEKTGIGDVGKMTSDFGTDKINAFDLLAMMMNGKSPEVKYTVRNVDGTTSTHTDIEATEAARSKYQKIKETWESWLFSDPNRADELATIYNDKHNRTVTRQYDGSHMTFAGMTPAMNGVSFAGLRQHQKDVVWRAIQDRNVLLDHVVGAGKTMAMAATAMEMRRLGIARKPLFVVPNHLTLQWRSEFTKLYPASNILAATPDDFAKDKREKMFSKMVTGNYDAIIIGHSSLKKVGLPAEVEARMYDQQVEEIANAIEEMKRERGDRGIVRDMEKIKTTLENKIKDLKAKAGKKDDVVNFDELGIDALFVDEMHEFKNLFFTTQMQRTSGLGNPKGSGKAFDLFMKIKWMTETFGEDVPLITATGTPVSNSLAEMFTMQRYMKFNEMKRNDLHLFDAWAKQYGEVENVYEVAPSGVGYRQSTRFSKFKNLPSLMGSYSSFADIITLQDLKDQTAKQLDADGKPKKFPVPKLKTGKPINVIARRSEYQTNFFGVPKLAEDEEGNIQFELEPSEAGIEVMDNGKWRLSVNNGFTDFETYEEAELELVTRALTPKTFLDPESLLGKFANLKQLTKETKGKINALSLTGLANKAGLDYRLIDPFAPDYPDSKINMSVNNMMQEYRNWTKDKGTQIVFCDMSIPNSARASMGSKEKRIYVRDNQRLLTHKPKGTVYASEGYEGYPFYMVKEKNGITIYEAVSGIEMPAYGIADKAAAKAWVDNYVQNEANRDRIFNVRDKYAIEQTEIDEYRDEKELEVAEDGSNEISLEDLEAIAGSSRFSVYDDIKAKLMAQGVPESEIAFIHDYNTPKQKDMLFKQVNRGEVRFLFGSTPKLGAGTNVQERLVALHHIDAPWRPSDLEQREGRIIRQGNKLYQRDPDGFEVGIYRYATEQTYDTRRWQLLEHKASGIEQLRKYSGESEIEDVTSEAANSADMKAAASGNPLILEETKLRAEVKRLTNLQKAHADSKYAMARKIKENERAISERWPSMIESFKERMALVKQYLIPEDKEQIADIVIDGKRIKSKASAENEIGLLGTKIRQSYLISENRPIVYRGIKFLLERGFYVGEMKLTSPDGTMHYYGVKDSFSPSGLITRFNNYIDSFESRIDNIRSSIEQAKIENESLSSRVNEPFELTDTLKQTQAKHADVQRKLMKSTSLEAVPEQQRNEFNRLLAKRKEQLANLGYDTALKEAELDNTDGNTDTAFSRSENENKGLPKVSVQIAVNKLRSGWKNAPEIVVVDDMNDPAIRKAVRDENQRQLSQGAKGQPEGFYDDGKVYILASEMNSPKDVIRVVFHETLGHYGLRGLYGKELGAILDQVAMLRKNDMAKKAKQYGLDLNKVSDRRIVAEEVLAEMAQTAPSAGFVKRAIAAIRNFLRSIGVNLELSDNDIIVNYLLPARRFVVNGGGGGGGGGVKFLPKFHRAWHGSPHDHNKFDMSKVGTGEGNQAYGYGLYFAGNKEVAEHYKKMLAFEKGFSFNGKVGLTRNQVQDMVDEKYGNVYLDNVTRPNGVADKVIDDITYNLNANITPRQYKEGSQRLELYNKLKVEITHTSQGKLYEVELAPTEDEYLLWDKPLSEQSDVIKKAIKLLPKYDSYYTGGQYYEALAKELASSGGDKYVSNRMVELGIRGIKYLDGSSRSQGEGNFNYVIFNDADVSIEAKFSRKDNINTVSDTPQFKAWFGDSKVVDADGKPLVVYRGDITPIEEFKGSAFFGSKEVANEFADPEQMYGSSKLNVGESPVVTPVYLSIKNPKLFTTEQEYDDYVMDGGEFSDTDWSKQGFDGVIYAPDGDIQSKSAYYKTFNPNQIKSAVGNNGNFDANNNDIRFSRTENSPIFYSQLSRAIQGAKQEAMPARQWKLWLVANAAKLGIKSDEIQWSGVTDWLDLQEGKVSKADIQSYLDANGVQVTETMLGDDNLSMLKPFTVEQNEDGWVVLDNNQANFPNGRIVDGAFEEEWEAQNRAESLNDDLADGEYTGFAGRAIHETKYGKYTVAGGESYKELLLTLPSTADYEVVNRYGEYIVYDNKGNELGSGKTEDDAIRSANVQKRKEGKFYQSSHFDKPNILAHVRFDERTDVDGKKVMFVNEVQSDWGQEGRKKGFANESGLVSDKLPDGWEVFESSKGWGWYVIDNSKTQVGIYMPTKEEAIKSALTRKGFTGATPTAPFVTDTKAWASLAIKNIIAHAVSNGFDKVAFINGEQAADLYDLSKQVDSIRASKNPNGETYAIHVRKNSGNDWEHLDGRVEKSKLADIVGKDLANRIIQDNSEKWVEYSGIDLKVGDEGMVGFYDGILTNVINEVSKRVGGERLVTIDSKTIDAHKNKKGVEYTNQTQQLLTITPELRNKVMNEGMPLFSRSNSSWNNPEPSKLDSVIYALQDKHIDLKRVTESIKKTGADIADQFNAYLQEELYHGRTAKRTQDFIKHDLDPLIEDMRARGVAMADFEEYLWARHAEERNIQIAKVNPDMPDGGSGMDTQDARDYLSNLTAEQKANYTALAKRIDAINRKSRQTLIDYGLESEKTIEAWQGAYKNYVPLMREDMDNGFGNGTGQGFSVKGNASKRATGSNRAVVDIIANMAQQFEKNVIRGEKNRVSKALIGLAELNPNKDFWKVDSPPKIKTVSKTTGLVEEYTDPNYKGRDNVVVARFVNDKGNIVERAVVFNQYDERSMRMAASVKNLDQDQIGELLGAASRFTRYFASINTQYNPIFGVVNIVRDVQGALLNLSATPIAGKQAEVFKQTGKAWLGIYRDLRTDRKTGKSSNSYWAQLFEEFQREGGQTGFRNMYANAAERGDALRNALDPTWWKNSKVGKLISLNGAIANQEQWIFDKAIKPIFNWLSDYNNSLENAVRLSVYKVALDNGHSKQQAASMAKNISVNFNRKGEMGRQIGSLYAFFNASVQGTARIGETLLEKDANGKTKLSAMGKRIVQGGLLLGAMQALLLSAAGYGDDEPPEFVRDRSLVIPLGDSYITVPMPLGFNAIPSLGRIVTEWALSGGEDTQKRLVHIMDMILNVTNPIGNAGLSIQTITPTIIDPLAALAENKDFTGRPIAREDFNSLNPTAGFTRSRDKAWDLSVAIAQAINYMTGGNDYKQGAISPTADQLEYLAGQFTGGVGREIIKAGTTLNALGTGEELPTYKVPLVGRFYGDVTGQASQGNAFYTNVRMMNEYQNEMKGIAKEGGDIAKFMESHPEARLARVSDLALRQVQNLRKQQRAIKETGGDNREAVRVIDERITQIMKRLNENVTAIKEGKAV